jgi:hypothetical protein
MIDDMTRMCHTLQTNSTVSQSSDQGIGSIWEAYKIRISEEKKGTELGPRYAVG